MTDIPDGYPAHRAVDVVLRDGATVRIRPARADDRERVEDYLIGLSDQSRYLRFGGVSVDVSEIARRATDVDYRDHLTLAGLRCGRRRRRGRRCPIHPRGGVPPRRSEREHRRQAPGPRSRLHPRRAPGGCRRRGRHLDVPRARAAREPPHDRRLPSQRLPRAPPGHARGRGRGVPDRAHRGGAPGVREPRTGRGRERGPSHRSSVVGRGDRRIAEPRFDRRTPPPQPARAAVHRRGARRQPQSRRRAGHRCVRQRAGRSR